jgi:peroxiredoxin
MPNIHKLYQKVSAENIAFVMVSMDEDIEKAKKFIKRKEYTFPVYTLKSGLPETFETNIIPTTFVINPSGKIVMRKEGMAKYDTEEFREFLTTMLKK